MQYTRTFCLNKHKERLDCVYSYVQQWQIFSKTRCDVSLLNLPTHPQHKTKQNKSINKKTWHIYILQGIAIMSFRSHEWFRPPNMAGSSRELLETDRLKCVG